MSNELAAVIAGILTAVMMLLTGCSFSVNQDIRNAKNQTKTWSLELFPSDAEELSK